MYFKESDFLKIYSTINNWFKNHEIKPKVITVDNSELKELLDKYNGQILVNIFNTSAGTPQRLFESTFAIQILTQKTKPTGSYYDRNIVDAASQDLNDLNTIYGLFDDFVTQMSLQDYNINITSSDDYYRVFDKDWEIVESTMSFSVMNQGRHASGN